MQKFNFFRYTVADYDIVIQNVTKPVKEYEKLAEKNNIKTGDVLKINFETLNKELEFKE